MDKTTPHRPNAAPIGSLSLCGWLSPGLMTVLIAMALPAARAHETHDTEAVYLGNAGVMVVHGDTKVVFDGFYRNDYGQYSLVPPRIEEALLTGRSPYDGIDALVVSHVHGDHFTPGPALDFLRRHGEVRFVAPRQAAQVLTRDLDENDPIRERITAFDLAPGDPPATARLGGVVVEAVRIAHAGGPGRASIENLAMRVTLDDTATALHFGDADPDERHFLPHKAHWDARHTHLALPPYWFFTGEAGTRILEKHIRPLQAIGVHVPKVATGNGALWRHRMGADVFTDPGETRFIRLQAPAED